MRHAFLTIAVTAGLLSASASAQSTPTQASMVPLRTLTVTGMAERKVTPDEAHVSVNLNSLNARMAMAKQEHDAKLRKLIAIVEKAGIDKSKVRTESSNVQPEYRYDNNKRTFLGYRVQTNVDVTVTPIDKVGALVEQIMTSDLEKGANAEWGNLLSMSYTIADPNKIRDDMTVDAIKNARAKAEKMATAVGTHINRVYQLSEGSAPSFGFPRPMPMMAMMKSADAEMAAAPVAPPPGEQALQSTVSVTFELKD